MGSTVSAYYYSLTQAEKDYFQNRWFDLPKAYSNKKNAEAYTDALYCRDDDWGNWNAYKHAYWSALNAWQFGTSRALLMGQNHESETPPGSPRDMDFYKNDLSISVFRSSSTQLAQNNEEYNIKVLARNAAKAISDGRGARITTENDGYMQPPSSTLLPTNGSGRCNLAPL